MLSKMCHSGIRKPHRDLPFQSHFGNTTSTHINHAFCFLFQENSKRILWGREEKQERLYSGLYFKVLFFLGLLVSVLRMHNCIIHVRFSWEIKSPKSSVKSSIAFQGIKHPPVCRSTPLQFNVLHLSLK
jgi:hypothetical protein